MRRITVCVALLAVGSLSLAVSGATHMEVTLDPNAPWANFEKDGNQGVVPGLAIMVLVDASGSDHVAFYATDADAGPDKEIEVAATFRIQSNDQPNGVDTGMRLVITDGAVTSAIVVCVTLGGVPGVAIALTTEFAGAENYAAFVPADWRNQISLKLRRNAAGDAEIVEVNGVPPTPRAIVPASSLPGPLRATPSVGFGLFSWTAFTTVEMIEFSSRAVGEPPVDPVAGSLTFSRFRVRDFESNDQLRFKADFKLGANSNGINPSTEPVTLRLSTPANDFYNQVLNGFTVKGQSPRRRWTLNDAERTRTGIERFDIDEDPNNAGALFLRDVRSRAGTGFFETVNVEIVIGTGAAADKLTGTDTLMQKPDGSGKWRLIKEP